MTAKDLTLSAWAGFIIGLFLIPTLQNNGLAQSLPFSVYFLIGIMPVLTLIGIHVAMFLGRIMPSLWQVSKFALVGVVNTSIDFGLFNFLIIVTGITSDATIILLNAISFSIAIINSFFWNKEWVFASKQKNRFSTFVIVTLMGLGINSAIVYGITTFIPPIIPVSEEQWANLAKVLATGVSMVWNFLGYRLVVFKRK